MASRCLAVSATVATETITATDNKADSNVTEDTEYHYLAAWLKVVTLFLRNRYFSGCTENVNTTISIHIHLENKYKRCIFSRKK